LRRLGKILPIRGIGATRQSWWSSLLDAKSAKAVVEPAGFAAELLGHEVDVGAAVGVGAPCDEAGFVEALAVEIDRAVFALPCCGDLLWGELPALRELLEDPDAHGVRQLGVEFLRKAEGRSGRSRSGGRLGCGRWLVTHGNDGFAVFVSGIGRKRNR